MSFGIKFLIPLSLQSFIFFTLHFYSPLSFSFTNTFISFSSALTSEYSSNSLFWTTHFFHLYTTFRTNFRFLVSKSDSLFSRFHTETLLLFISSFLSSLFLKYSIVSIVCKIFVIASCGSIVLLLFLYSSHFCYYIFLHAVSIISLLSTSLIDIPPLS